MAKLRINYNAPVVLTFAIAAVAAFILMNAVESTKLWFVAWPKLYDTRAYVGMFSLILGHGSWIIQTTIVKTAQTVPAPQAIAAASSAVPTVAPQTVAIRTLPQTVAMQTLVTRAAAVPTPRVVSPTPGSAGKRATRRHPSELPQGFG